MKMKCNVRVEVFKNTDYRSYYIDKVISKKIFENFSYPLQDYQKEYLQDIGEIGASLVKRVLSVPGVVEVSVVPDRVTVMIAESFKWKNVEPAIIAAIKGKKIKTRKVNPKIIVETVPEHHAISLRCNKALSETPIEMLTKLNMEFVFDKIGTKGTTLVKNLLAMPDIKTMFICPYNIKLIKKDDSGWDEMLPMIIKKIKKIYPSLRRALVIPVVHKELKEEYDPEDEYNPDYYDSDYDD